MSPSTPQATVSTPQATTQTQSLRVHELQCNSSYHYSKRIGRNERHRDYVKTTVAVDTKTLAVAAVKPRLKRRHDLVDAKPVLRKAGKAGRIRKVIADRGYDSEEFLRFITQELQAEPVVALKYCDKPLEKTHGKLRRKLKQDFPHTDYPQRNMTETTNSTTKRRYSHTIRARKNHTQKIEVLLKYLTHNLSLNKLVEILKDFYKAKKFILSKSPIRRLLRRFS